MADKKPTEEEKAQDSSDLEGGSETTTESTSTAVAGDDTSEDAQPKDTARKPDEGKMWIKVYSPYQVYYDNQGQSISAINETGPFDILAHHHKFLTLLEPCELVIANDTDEQKIKIARGVMFVKEDRVTVFLDI